MLEVGAITKHVVSSIFDTTNRANKRQNDRHADGVNELELVSVIRKLIIFGVVLGALRWH